MAQPSGWGSNVLGVCSKTHSLSLEPANILCCVALLIFSFSHVILLLSLVLPHLSSRWRKSCAVRAMGLGWVYMDNCWLSPLFYFMVNQCSYTCRLHFSMWLTYLQVPGIRTQATLGDHSASPNLGGAQNPEISGSMMLFKSNRRGSSVTVAKFPWTVLLLKVQRLNSGETGNRKV